MNENMPLHNTSHDACQRRVAIISDTHGHINPNIINAIEACDRIVHAGNICGAQVLSQLDDICPHITAVTGSNDSASSWHESEASIVNALPAIAEIELPGGTLAVEHGHRHGIHQPDHASLRASHPHARIIVYGHTHGLLVDDSETPWVINPGAAGKTRTGDEASCLILTAVSRGEWSIDIIRCNDKDEALA